MTHVIITHDATEYWRRMFHRCQGSTMKPFQALGCRVLLLFLMLSEGVECRPIQGTKRGALEALLLSIVRGGLMAHFRDFY